MESAVVVLFVAGGKLGIQGGCWAGIIEFDACIHCGWWAVAVAGPRHNKDAVQPCQKLRFTSTHSACHSFVCG